ncbi:primary-amine oxidase [Gloeocapsa sp. PCC 73106]|uniref:primary-amine oxidase n=1 Tax=Gloeocapsa sp. PCC 73106 TaxID=102232 RepID=UPI0002ABCD52|nr:primary-amine oxidase [Gloeocapsa sp. PCC 73106]ELR97052.1 Cu2+-containing amine oxidase [Gloeocapsa sp. PCC 73106]
MSHQHHSNTNNETEDSPREENSSVHPLDPLTATEIEMSLEIIRQEQSLSEATFFPRIALHEPSKRKLENHLSQNTDINRRAFVIVFDAEANTTYEAVVDLTTERILNWRAVPDVFVQLLDPVDYETLEELVFADPEVQEALSRRGLEPDDVYFTGWAPGRLSETERATGSRLIRGIPYVIGDDINFYGRPIEGLQVTVDLTRNEVLDVVDSGNIPIAGEAGFAADEVDLRDSQPPLEIIEPEGSSYEIEGNEITWDNWKFRYSIDPRTGIVLHQVDYQDGDTLRPILHRGSLSEIFVPYGDPDPNWSVRSALDVGEYSLGRLTYQMEVGRDVPENALLLDATFADDLGEPYLWEGAGAIYERQGGLLWSHFDFELTEQVEARRGRELVLRFITTIGNYDYAVNWVFQQDGTLKTEVDLTGIVLAKGTRATDVDSLTASDDYGSLIAPNLIGVNHQHFFNFRLDLDVDGKMNMPMEMSAVPVTSDLGNAFVMEERMLESELNAVRDVDVTSSRMWMIHSTEQENYLGEPTAYMLMPGENAFSQLSEEAEGRAVAGFTNHHVWMTQYDQDELYGAGDYPNQGRPQQGLPSYVENDESLMGEDVVLWYTMGTTHMVRTEDWPIMPVHEMSFKLKPWNFFDRNPALDIPPNPSLE